MRVTVTRFTDKPMNSVAFAAGVCYGKRDCNHERAVRCIRNGHLSVVEHVGASFFIEGVSRDLLAQITRHRLFSFSVKSQRYCKMDGTEDIVVPKDIADVDEFAAEFDKAYNHCLAVYGRLVESGVKAEDARYILPGCCTTDIYATANMREVDHFFEVRTDPHAQWEIRALANEMICELKAIDDQWYMLVSELEHRWQGR